MKVENPVKMEDSTVKTLEDAFARGCNVTEACLFANISRQTYYNWIESYPEQKERFDILGEKVKMKAKLNIAQKVEDGDVDTSKWYLERKGKDEGFSPRQELTGKDGKDLSVQVVNYADTTTPQLPAENVSTTAIKGHR